MKYNVEIKKESLVTTFYDGHGIVPNRQIAARIVTITNTTGNQRCGIITLHGKVERVTSHMTGTRWSEWETEKMIAPCYIPLSMRDEVE
jgi:hypothetical protein